MKTSEFLSKLNTVTKYPSIVTYHHKRGSKGLLEDEVQVDFSSEDNLYVTEKVDGTNVRIIVSNHVSRPYLIGSREELLWAHGDLIVNPTLNIVENVRHHAEPVQTWATRSILVVYGEHYGSSVTKAGNQYTGQPNTFGFRVFDVAEFPRDILSIMKEKEIRDLSGMRDRFELQEWVSEFGLFSMCADHGLKPTPRLTCIKGKDFPTSVKDTYEFLKEFEKTRCLLDESGKEKSEGIVVRSIDRKKIAKIKFRDYERTLRE